MMQIRKNIKNWQLLIYNLSYKRISIGVGFDFRSHNHKVLWISLPFLHISFSNED